ncbi:MAG: tetratricopeptide repeat protein, partial [Sphingobacteriales bacterium]
MKAFCFLLLVPCLFFGQVTIPAPELLRYKDFAVTDSLLYFLKWGDTLEIRDVRKKDAVPGVRLGIRSVKKGRKGSIYALTAQGAFITLSGGAKSQAEIQLTPGYQLLLDKNDSPVILSSSGIYYKDSTYLPGKEILQSVSIRQREKSLPYPVVSFIDSQNRLWLGYDHGEFGGGCFIFDLSTLEFVDLDKNKPKITLGTLKLHAYPNQYIHNIKDIAEDPEGNLLFSQSLMHFGVTGSLSLAQKRPDRLYNSAIRLNGILDYTTKIKDRSRLAEYLGPVTYNPFNKSFYYYSDKGDYQKAIPLFTKSVNINIAIGNKNNLASNYNNIGTANQRRGNFTEALKYNFKALKIAEEIKSDYLTATLYNNISNVFIAQTDYDKALQYSSKALKVHTKQKDTDGMASATNSIADIFYLKKDFKNAGIYYKEALELFKS